MEPREYLDATPIFTDPDDRTIPRPQWLLAKAYVRLSRSGTIKLNRWNAPASFDSPTNHENDLWLIEELADAGLLRKQVDPQTINLFPSGDGADWLAVMDDMDDPSAPPEAYVGNPLYGTL